MVRFAKLSHLRTIQHWKTFFQLLRLFCYMVNTAIRTAGANICSFFYQDSFLSGAQLQRLRDDSLHLPTHLSPWTQPPISFFFQKETGKGHTLKRQKKEDSSPSLHISSSRHGVKMKLASQKPLSKIWFNNQCH